MSGRGFTSTVALTAAALLAGCGHVTWKKPDPRYPETVDEQGEAIERQRDSESLCQARGGVFRRSPPNSDNRGGGRCDLPGKDGEVRRR